MLRSFILFLGLAITNMTSHGQSMPRLPQHIYWKTLLNPAARPIKNITEPGGQLLSFGFAVRNPPLFGQQNGLDAGAYPRYLAARFDWIKEENIDKRKKTALFSGAGADLHRYQTGPLTRYSIMGRLSSSTALNKSWKMSIGFSPGYIFQQIDVGRLIALHPDDPVLANLRALQGQIVMGWGVFASYKKQSGNNQECMWFGISQPQAYTQALAPNQMDAAPSGWCKTPFLGMVGRRFIVGASDNSPFYIDADLLTKIECNLPMSWEPAIKFLHRNLETSGEIWLQTGYSTGSNIWFWHLGFQGKMAKVMDRWYWQIAIGHDRYLHKYYTSFRDNIEFSLTLFRSIEK